MSNKEKIDKFLSQPHLARFATADPDTLQPHVVPVWYLWDGESVWISSYRSTRKIGELEANPKCSMVVDVTYGGNHNEAVSMEGEAEIITDRETVVDMSTKIYARYLGDEGVKQPDPQEWIHSPENLIIRLKPSFVRYWETT